MIKVSITVGGRVVADDVEVYNTNGTYQFNLDKTHTQRLLYALTAGLYVKLKTHDDIVEAAVLSWHTRGQRELQYKAWHGITTAFITKENGVGCTTAEKSDDLIQQVDLNTLRHAVYDVMPLRVSIGTSVVSYVRSTGSYLVTHSFGSRDNAYSNADTYADAVAHAILLHLCSMAADEGNKDAIAYTADLVRRAGIRQRGLHKLLEGVPHIELKHDTDLPGGCEVQLFGKRLQDYWYK